MIKDLKSVKIGPVWNGGNGASFKDEILAEPDLGADIRLSAPVTGELLLVRMKNGVTAVLNNLQTTAHMTCSRCLENYGQALSIPCAEAHFYEEPPHRDYDQLEVYFIQMKDMSVDLTDALRQEIILHFPMIPVCSNRCKGLCPSCSVNLNRAVHCKGCTAEKDHKQPAEPSDSYKPFADLKKLIGK